MFSLYPVFFLVVSLVPCSFLIVYHLLFVRLKEERKKNLQTKMRFQPFVFVLFAYGAIAGSSRGHSDSDHSDDERALSTLDKEIAYVLLCMHQCVSTLQRGGDHEVQDVRIYKACYDECAPRGERVTEKTLADSFPIFYQLYTAHYGKHTS